MITRKIKIGKFLYSLSRSIQNIAHHSESFFDGVISEGKGGGVCMSFFVTQPILYNFKISCIKVFKFDYQPKWRKFVYVPNIFIGCLWLSELCMPNLKKR